MAPTRAPKTTCVSTMPGWTIPLPTVAATLRWKTKTATTLKKAAKATACVGLSTPVETTVAIELAASWKPFMKSNSKASTTSRITTHRAACTDSITKRLREGSGILEDDALDQVGHVLAAVGHRLQQLVDGLELDDFAHIGLFAEQLAHGRAHHAVGVRFEAVDFLAGLHRRVHHRWIGDARQQLDRIAQPLAAAHAQVGQARDLIRHVAHVVQRHGLGRVL